MQHADISTDLRTLRSDRAGVRSWLILAGFVAAVGLVAAAGGAATGPAVRDWYPALAKPAWTPPGWVFGPVWTILYGMMAVAAWLVWRRSGWNWALAWFTVQLGLNGLWSPVFFGLQKLGWSVIVIGLLWIAIAGTLVAFWRKRLLAGLLLAPYLAWVTFAAVLNIAIWRLNAP
jgi:tryptophan-rich sensory protein